MPAEIDKTERKGYTGLKAKEKGNDYEKDGDYRGYRR